jgi:hypothetical protein
MSRVLYRSHILFRSLNLSQHVNKSISNISYYLLQRRLSTQASIQTTQDVSESGPIKVDRLYRRAKRLVETKRHDIERSMMKTESKVTQAPSDYIRFPKPKKCVKAENRLLKSETTLERNVFLLSLITTIVKPKEVIPISKLIDRLTHYQKLLDKYEFDIKVALKTEFLRWLLQPSIKRYIQVNIPGIGGVPSKGKKLKKKLRNHLII